MFDKVGNLKDVSNLNEKTNSKEWENQFFRVLNKHDPLKSKVNRESKKPFVTKALGKSLCKDQY